LELANLIGTIGPLEVRGGATGQIAALTYDAAAAVPGALHFCVPGFRVDGHDFAEQAEAAGAVALVVERFLDIDLPQRTNQPPPDTTPPEPIKLRIDASGQVFWNESPTPMSALRNMMQSEVERDPNNQPTLEIDTNDDADYGVLAKVLATARNANMQKIGFVKK